MHDKLQKNWLWNAQYLAFNSIEFLKIFWKFECIANFANIIIIIICPVSTILKQLYEFCFTVLAYLCIQLFFFLAHTRGCTNSKLDQMGKLVCLSYLTISAFSLCIQFKFMCIIMLTNTSKNVHFIHEFKFLRICVMHYLKW